MKRERIFTSLLLAGVLCAGSTAASFAAVVDENAPSDSVQQKVSFTKTAEEVVPSYTVTIPATVSLSREAQDLTFSMNLEDHSEFVPNGKKVSVKIESAGYPTVNNKFALWDSRNLNEAEYQFYETDHSAARHTYNIGDEIASWEGSNWGTLTRRIQVTDFETLEAGTYSGFINYSISLEDK